MPVVAVEPAAAEALGAVGIVAGTTLAVERVIPFGGPVVVRLGTPGSRSAGASPLRSPWPARPPSAGTCPPEPAVNRT